MYFFSLTDSLDKGKPKEKFTLSENLDEATRKKFEKKFGNYRSRDYPYSIQNVLWMMGSIALFYYTDFYIAVRYDPRVNRYVHVYILILIEFFYCSHETYSTESSYLFFLIKNLCFSHWLVYCLRQYILLFWFQEWNWRFW